MVRWTPAEVDSAVQPSLGSFSQQQRPNNIRTETWEREQRVLFEAEPPPHTHPRDVCQCGSRGPEHDAKPLIPSSLSEERPKSSIRCTKRKERNKQALAEACHITSSVCVLAAERREECAWGYVREWVWSPAGAASSLTRAVPERGQSPRPALLPQLCPPSPDVMQVNTGSG